MTLARGACGLPVFHRSIKLIAVVNSRKPAGATPVVHEMDERDDTNLIDLENVDAVDGRIDGVVDSRITLSLGDLLPDENGEIVIQSDGDSLHLSIVTDLRVCDSGVSGEHLTADGVDVAGLYFFTFESGTKLYFPADLDVTVSSSSNAG